MNKKSLDALANEIIYEKPKIYSYLMKKINNKIDSSFTTFLYKDHCYCPKCKKVVYAIRKNYFVPPVVVWCSNCGKKIEVNSLSSRIKKEKINRYIFDVLEVRQFCLVNQTYCISHYYNFKKGIMEFKESLFKLGCEVYDLETGDKKIKQINTYSSGWGERYIFPFANAYAKNAGMPFGETRIFYHPSYEDVNYISGLFFTNDVKKKFLKYFDIEDIEVSFKDNLSLISFVRCLNIYPKLETLYKLENYTWTNDRYDFFQGVLDCLKRKNGYEKENYHLFRDIYISSGRLDFNYYSVNVKLGKPFIKEKLLIDWLWTHKAYIKRDIVNYLSVQPFYLYDDYIKMSKTLNLNLKDKKILFPKSLKEAHDDLVFRLEEKQIEKVQYEFLALKQKYSLLEFEEAGYVFSLPITVSGFKTRGKYLRQCLYSAKYYEKYLKGNCIILFIDNKESSNVEYQFTLELNKRLNIVQLHGFANDVNCSERQKINLSVVNEIISKRLDLLKNGKRTSCL